jgi:hypothetical protein
VSKAGDHTFNRTTVKSECSRAIFDGFVNVLGCEDRTRNEEHFKKKNKKNKKILKGSNRMKGKIRSQGKE